MKTIILATVAVLGIGVGAAYAGDGEDGGTIANTWFSELPRPCGRIGERRV
jgi:hypothetical protein